MPRVIVVVAALLVALLLAAQLVPAKRTNPPAGAVIRPPAEVAAVLARSCFDCHSNATRWPWYAHVAPMSWMLLNHVREGRQNVNFSYWGDLPPNERATKAKAVVDQITLGKMPLSSYLLIHRDARLQPAEAQLLRAWFSAPEALRGAPADSTTSGHGAAGDEGDEDWPVR